MRGHAPRHASAVSGASRLGASANPAFSSLALLRSPAGDDGMRIDIRSTAQQRSGPPDPSHPRGAACCHPRWTGNLNGGLRQPECPPAALGLPLRGPARQRELILPRWQASPSSGPRQIPPCAGRPPCCHPQARNSESAPQALQAWRGCSPGVLEDTCAGLQRLTALSPADHGSFSCARGLEIGHEPGEFANRRDR